MNVYLVHFHHGVESISVRANSEDDVYEAFEAHEDWALEAVEFVREATAADHVNIPLFTDFDGE